jgi:hypothetical protein
MHVRFSFILARAGKWFFVMTRTCPGFAGRIVIKTITFVSSYTTLAGALPATISQNTQFFMGANLSTDIG